MRAFDLTSFDPLFSAARPPSRARKAIICATKKEFRVCEHASLRAILRRKAEHKKRSRHESPGRPRRRRNDRLFRVSIIKSPISYNIYSDTRRDAYFNVLLIQKANLITFSLRRKFLLCFRDARPSSSLRESKSFCAMQIMRHNLSSKTGKLRNYCGAFVRYGLILDLIEKFITFYDANRALPFTDIAGKLESSVGRRERP